MNEKFHPFEIPLDRAKALSFFITLCEARKIKLKKVIFVMNGFQVFFEDMKGDAILHDGSYGRSDCSWETYGMPWDYDDVSVHDAVTLANMIYAHINGKSWETYEKPSPLWKGV